MSHSILIAIACLLVLVWLFWFRVEKYSGPAGPILEAIAKNEKNQGTFMDFRNRIGDKNFSPSKYSKLMALHRTNKLDVAAVDKIMSGSD